VFSPIEFSIKHSRSLIVLILGSHFLSLYCLYIAVLDVTIASFLTIAVLVSLGWSLQHYAVDNTKGITGIRFNGAQKQISVKYRTEWCTATEVVNAVVLPYAVVLGFRLEGSRLSRYAVVFFDALEREDYRRLKVFALHGAYVKDPDAKNVS